MGRLGITALPGEGSQRERPWGGEQAEPRERREGPGWGSPKESGPRTEREPLSHLEKEGPSVLLLQGVLQLRHVALQLQVFVPGIFHLLLAKETLCLLAVLAPRSPMHTCAPDHSRPARGRGRGPAGLVGLVRETWAVFSRTR